MRPAATYLLKPIAGDELVSLWQGVHTVPNPLLWTMCFGCRIKNILSLNVNRVVILCQSGNHSSKFVRGGAVGRPCLLLR